LPEAGAWGGIIVNLNLYAMARSQNSFLKKQLEQNKAKKKKEKEQRKQERHEHATSGKLEDMLAYVDEFGNITSTPPEKKQQEEQD
jgi:hypothetical protein